MWPFKLQQPPKTHFEDKVRNCHFLVIKTLIGGLNVRSASSFLSLFFSFFMHFFWQTYSMTSAAALFTYSTSKTFARGIHRTSGSSSRLMFTVGGANCARHDTASPRSSSSVVRSIFRSSAPETADSSAFLWRATITTTFPLQAFHNKRKKLRTYANWAASAKRRRGTWSQNWNINGQLLYIKCCSSSFNYYY